MGRSLLSFISTCALVALSAYGALAAPIPGTLLNTFLSPDRPTSGAEFGWDIAAFNNTFFVSDPFTPEGGAVYQFDRDGNVLRKIYYPDTTDGARFGYAIDVVGNHLVVGATNAASETAVLPGAVFLYNATTGAFERRLDSPSPGFGPLSFGQSLAHIGNQLIVGNSNHSVPMFNADTGALIREFNTTPRGSFFGAQVAAVGNQVFTSAPQAGSGNIYAFDLNTGALNRTIFGGPVDATALGIDLTISASGDILAGGADGSNNNARAFVFDDLTGAPLRTYSLINGTTHAYPVGTLGPFDLVATWNFPNSGGAVNFFDAAGELAFAVNIPKQGTSVTPAASLAAFGNDLLVGAPGPDGAVYLFSTPVPEPSALALAAAGFVSLSGYVWRRKRRCPTG